jgi:hypothetical protein
MKLAFHKNSKFLDQLSDYQLLKGKPVVGGFKMMMISHIAGGSPGSKYVIRRVLPSGI